MPAIYRATCSECQRDLELRNWSIDADGDVSVDVVLCTDCTDTAREEAKAEAKEGADDRERESYERGLAEGRADDSP